MTDAKEETATSDDNAVKTVAKKKATKKKATKKRTTNKKTTKKKATKQTKSTIGVSKLRVKQIRSMIHRQKTLARTLTAIGIKHHQDEVVVTDTPAMRGMLRKVSAFVRVTPEES